MHIEVRFNGASPRRWHVSLLERLARREAVSVSADARPCPGGMPRNGGRLLRLERLVYRLPCADLSAPAAAADFAAFGKAPGPVDLVLDLCGDVPAERGRVWRLTFDELDGDQGLLACLLDGRVPVATIRDQAGRTIITSRLGSEAGGVAAASFEDGLARATTLVMAALDGGGSASLPHLDGDTPRGPPPHDIAASRLAKRAAKTLARSLTRRLYYRFYHAPHWRVGWRKLVGPDLVDLREHPPEGWQDLPDDGSRFYADPFPIEHGGGVTLFVEDYVHSLGRGIISAVAFGPEGPLGAPEPVLDLGYHLSYPFVFEADGEVWMIPESCAAGRIDLFRATAFPRGWVLERTLVPDVVASDATILRVEGRWWMFATVRDGGGAYSDSLHLWSAPDFRGPWSAHAGNPVLIDIASARPAGRIVERDGVLVRPVQDCRDGYGAAMGLARILRLDDTGIEQVVETVLRAGPCWPGRRLHTLNVAGGFEFIDGSGEARRRLLPTLTRRNSS